MKIGILTLHSQLNYGGVLQCWALQHALTRMLSEKGKVKSEKLDADEVVVIDRWLTPDNWHLERGYNHWGVRQWLKFALRVLLGCGDLAPWMRYQRTKRFIRSQLNLTPYHFYNWSEVSASPAMTAAFRQLDVVVVGSDQVWHGGVGTWSYPTPDPYLLKGAPQIRAIAYAASFGMTSLPPEIDYAGGFKRFEAIGVRETEGVGLVESAGGMAVHVVDPTLLLQREDWSALGTINKRYKHTVIYCLVEELDVERIEQWAQQTGRCVTVICEGAGLKPFPKSLRMLALRACESVRNCFSSPSVRIVYGYGPREFFRAFAEADECITNSFHAVMFSYICNCNVRVLRPVIEERKAMFARIEEFAQTAVRGNIIVSDLLAAFDSLDNDPRVVFDGAVINARREFSQNWLRHALCAFATDANCDL